MRTLHRMGIESVVVFSEADKDAVYVKEATTSICIGPAQAKESYLLQDAILEAAMQTESEAVHPGFGFLSENAQFAERCRQQKLTFIGPSSPSITLMGDKARARETMAALGVKTLSGSHGIVRDVHDARARADESGFPILLKARARGGGKVKRLDMHAGDLERAYGEAQIEAESAFGDGGLYLEKFVTNARHIEFQVLGDGFGNVIVLGERECSIQRKNQKLIEEAPANEFSAEQRERAIAIITDAMRKLGYHNAGTVEFLLAPDGELYFMEMNTRIQVEHPVTEFIFGVDIVEWQVRIACGEMLTLRQGDLCIDGHAIECRINAENPGDNFLPSPGVITKLRLPRESKALRIDTHVEEGFRVTPFYDSMLAKVIAHGKTRSDAIATMKQALTDLQILGVHTTADFHRAILSTAAFGKGRYDCSFIEKNLDQLLKSMGA
jgi:acetyl-CoA carboxylase biotin carboxylase subunit